MSLHQGTAFAGLHKKAASEMGAACKKSTCVLHKKLCCYLSLYCSLFFKQSIPNLFPLQPSYEVHNTHKNKKERTGKTKQGYIPGAIKFFHGPAQSFGNNVHAWHHYQCKEEGEYETENNGPAKRPPENHTVATKEYMWVQVLKE